MLTWSLLSVVGAVASSPKPVGSRKIAELAGVSVAEAWRQARELEEWGVLLAVRGGRYRKYVVNNQHPLTPYLIGLWKEVGRFRWLMGKTLVEALSALDKAYVSGAYAVKSLLPDLAIPEGVLVVADADELSRVEELKEWFAGRYEVDVLVGDLSRAAYFKDPLGINVAYPEQAVADAAEAYPKDPINNLYALLLPLHTSIDFAALKRALDMWSEEALYRVWFVLRVGRLFGKPLPTSLFKPKRCFRDSVFERRAVAEAKRLLAPRRLVVDRGW